MYTAEQLVKAKYPDAHIVVEASGTYRLRTSETATCNNGGWFDAESAWNEMAISITKQFPLTAHEQFLAFWPEAEVKYGRKGYYIDRHSALPPELCDKSEPENYRSPRAAWEGELAKFRALEDKILKAYPKSSVEHICGGRGGYVVFAHENSRVYASDQLFTSKGDAIVYFASTFCCESDYTVEWEGKVRYEIKRSMAVRKDANVNFLALIREIGDMAATVLSGHGHGSVYSGCVQISAQAYRIAHNC